ncbi:glutathione S-transferase family protein [Pseudomaricurvus alkylphenolicus]|uniref:glutathione S-transferase family protein n=1 Tax=Pseudomaricurvus alkylphenolicus TaxID=1306991 RepID=UPI001420C036|nr:glutathione S-transferase family protein [Pseudomaricurvus alkylphenolicus]NIB43431.1 glutathione S-transferase family protein [Pseudomaricurvus alkylphenolicus]
MSEIVLYMAPGTCARVTAIALEELGLEYETRVVRFLKGEHKSPHFKQYNPKGKVPCLVYQGEALTENVAILYFLNQRHGGLLPEVGTMEQAKQIADLCFCGTTLHPLVTRIRMPHFFAGEEGAGAVREIGSNAMDEYFQLIESRLNTRSWWYGDDWSAMDAYLYWCFWRVEGAGYDVSRFPAFVGHARRMEDRPAVRRALAREADAEDVLREEGLLFTPPPVVSTPS